MDAIKEYFRIADRLEHEEITLEEYEKLCEPLRNVVEVVHGKWIAKPFGYGECSHCHAKTGNRFTEKFCYNCGARMDGDK